MVNVNTTTEVSLNIHDLGLNGKQKRFVIHYAGDGSAAAKIAGYTPDDQGRYNHHARRLLANPTVIKAIKRRDDILKTLPHSTDPVMDVDQLRQWWTQIISDTQQGIGHRINCSKLLAQSYGAFIERIIVDEHKELEINYTFSGPRSRFLESREQAALPLIEVKAIPHHDSDINDLL